MLTYRSFRTSLCQFNPASRVMATRLIRTCAPQFDGFHRRVSLWLAPSTAPAALRPSRGFADDTFNTLYATTIRDTSALRFADGAYNAGPQIDQKE